MSNKKFGKLISERLENQVPNKDYFSVLLSETELVHLISCLYFTKRHSYFYSYDSCIDSLINYLHEFLKCK